MRIELVDLLRTVWRAFRFVRSAFPSCMVYEERRVCVRDAFAGSVRDAFAGSVFSSSSVTMYSGSSLTAFSSVSSSSSLTAFSSASSTCARLKNPRSPGIVLSCRLKNRLALSVSGFRSGSGSVPLSIVSGVGGDTVLVLGRLGVTVFQLSSSAQVCWALVPVRCGKFGVVVLSARRDGDVLYTVCGIYLVLRFIRSIDLCVYLGWLGDECDSPIGSDETWQLFR